MKEPNIEKDLILGKEMQNDSKSLDFYNQIESKVISSNYQNTDSIATDNREP